MCKLTHIIAMTARNITSKCNNLIELFELVCQHPHYWNQWKPGQQWVGMINATYPALKMFEFAKGDLNKTIGQHPQLEHIQLLGTEGNIKIKPKKMCTWRKSTPPNLLAKKPASDSILVHCGIFVLTSCTCNLDILLFYL